MPESDPMRTSPDGQGSPSGEGRTPGAVVSPGTGGSWIVEGRNGFRLSCDTSLDAELHGMEHLRGTGGGELIVRDRRNRFVRRLIIPAPETGTPPC